MLTPFDLGVYNYLKIVNHWLPDASLLTKTTYSNIRGTLLAEYHNVDQIVVQLIIQGSTVIVALIYNDGTLCQQYLQPIGTFLEIKEIPDEQTDNNNDYKSVNYVNPLFDPVINNKTV